VEDKDTLVKVEDLRTYFFLNEGTVRAVDGADFTIKRGKTLGVVGESGCGKSVCARSIMRIVAKPGRIVGGHIWYHQHNKNGAQRSNGNIVDSAEVIDLTTLDPQGDKARSLRGGEISMVFQEPMTSLSPVHTIGNQIEEVIMLHQRVSKQEARARAIEMLDKVGMPYPARTIDRYSHELSGGMRQRAMIAMALSCNPQVVIADEPTTALDVMIQAQILELLDELRRKLGLAVIFVTHDLGVVAEMCDSVLVMYGGMTAEYAAVDTIFNAPRHPYTQELIKAFPDLSRMDKRLTSIPGYPPKLDALPPGCRFAPRCPLAFERCTQEVPPLYSLNGGDHIVSCHLVEK
jgi:oligopeptide/dipeptide ABC transporter ATP-binding protein